MALDYSHIFTTHLSKQAPFLRILIFLSAGIWLYSRFERPTTSIFIFCLLIVVLCYSLFLIKHPVVAPRVRPVCICVSLLAIGWILAFLHQNTNRKNFVEPFLANAKLIEATFEEPAMQKPKSWKAIASMQVLDSAGRAQKCAGKVIIYFQQDSLQKQLPYGTKIVFSKIPDRIKSEGNPGGFDYKAVTARQNLYFQVFLKKGEYAAISQWGGNWWKHILFQWQEKILQTIRKYIPGETEVGVAQALLLGYKGDLDKQLVEQFAKTGTAHIIAISGMHLGLIYGVLLLMFKPLPNTIKGKFLKVFLTLSIIWIFTLMTGAAPSISRAATMFSIMALGQLWQRKISSVNLLCLAACILLLYDPFYLWDIGFQLSFSALLSIVLFYRPIYEALYSNHTILNYIWSATAVTLAAQIITTPIVMLHFHQFPLYFLIANLVSVPVSGLALYGLIGIVVFSGIPFLATIIGKATQWLIWIMDITVIEITKWPLATIDQIQISPFQTLLLLLAFSTLTSSLLFKKKVFAKWGFVAMVLFFSLRTFHHIQSQQQEKLLIFNIPNHIAFDYIKGNHSYFWADTLLTEKGFMQNFHVLPSRIFFRYNASIVQNPPDSSGYIVKIGNKTLVVVNRAIEVKEILTKADILLVTSKVKSAPLPLIQLFKPKQLVLCGNPASYYGKAWAHCADSLHLPIHILDKQGAFVLNFKKEN